MNTKNMVKPRKRRKKNLLTSVITLLFFACLALTLLYLFQKPVVILSQVTRFPVGQKVLLSDLVTEVKNGSLQNQEETFDANSAGSRQITLYIKTRLGTIQEQSLVIEFFDDIAPTITAPDSLSIMAGETPDLLKDASAVDDNGEICRVTLTGEYDLTKPGVYTLFFTAQDSTGNVAQKEFVLTVLSMPYDENGKLVDGVYTTATGHELKVVGGIAYVDGYLIANKTYSLPKTYTSNWMSDETATAYSKMQSAASKEGLNLKVKSAYRSWFDQDWIFRDYVRRDSLENALTYSARPGHSEHQTGLGLDLVTSSSSEVTKPGIAEALAWLNENAYKYGFILRYPEGKTNETGYVFEPWHYRYVGTELAQILYNNGDWITMETYFGIDSLYRGYDQ